MKISLDWLKDLIEITETPDELSALLTQTGLEVEGLETFESVPGGLNGVVIGEVLECGPHPDADKLSVTKVDIGNEVKPIVCGAPNVAKGQKVAVATIGTTLYGPDGSEFKIKKAKIRGEVSEGMICAEDELNLGTSHDGIMVLDTDLPNGTPAAEYFNVKSDVVIEIGLTPNRAEGASHLGVVRDIRAVKNREIKLPAVDSFKVDKIDNPVEVEVLDLKGSPRFSGVTIRDITVKDSPKWLQNRLKAIGLTPINNIVDATNYILHELGQPMHAYDADVIADNKVVVRTMPAGTKFTTLDEKERVLLETDLIVCDGKEGMCIAGVFGGVRSGVKASTKNIFLESAYFSPAYVRQTSTKHGLKTDASFRFERGTDPNITVYALKRAALLIKEIAGGYIASEVTDIYPEPIAHHTVKVKISRIHQLIGKAIPKEEILSILNRLDINVENDMGNEVMLSVPPFRVDVTREADIVEEVLRIYGYDNIELKDTLSAESLADFPQKDKSKLIYRISTMLADNGYFEIMNNSLTNSRYTEKIKAFDSEKDVKILNKLSEDLDVMRQSILFGGLESIAHNINRKQKNIKFFEIGNQYRYLDGQYVEDEKLGLWITGNDHEDNWRLKSKNVEFHDLKETVLKVIGRFVSTTPETTVFSDDTFSYGLLLKIGQNNVAKLGLLSKDVLVPFEVKQAVYYAEIDVQRLMQSDKAALTYKQLSKFPEVYRDLSLVINKSVTFSEIIALTEEKEFNLIKDVKMFDYYEGEKIDKDKKAYALTFVLQDDNKTLTDNVIDKIMNKLIAIFEQKLGAVIRK